MTNQEKYKTAREREQAFVRFCGQHTCNSCPLDERRKVYACGCTFGWLEMEAEEEVTPKPCPFCGGKASAIEVLNCYAIAVRCDNCHATSGNYDTKEEAITAWNRRAK